MTGERRGRGKSRTGIEDLWAWTMGWGLTVGVELGDGAGESNGKKRQDNCNQTTIKK